MLSAWPSSNNDLEATTLYPLVEPRNHYSWTFSSTTPSARVARRNGRRRRSLKNAFDENILASLLHELLDRHTWPIQSRPGSARRYPIRSRLPTTPPDVIPLWVTSAPATPRPPPWQDSTTNPSAKRGYFKAPIMRIFASNRSGRGSGLKFSSGPSPNFGLHHEPLRGTVSQASVA